MNKTNLLVAAGLMILATACKENDTVKPVTSYSTINYPEPQNKPRTAEEEDSILVSIVKPTRVPQEVPVPLYGKDVIPQAQLEY